MVFRNQKLCFRKIMVFRKDNLSAWFSLENLPIKFLPIRSVNARMLAANRRLAKF